MNSYRDNLKESQGKKQHIKNIILLMIKFQKKIRFIFIKGGYIKTQIYLRFTS